MFGTDYIMIMLDKYLGGLEKYFGNFTVFNNRLPGDNVKDLLKI